MLKQLLVTAALVLPAALPAVAASGAQAYANARYGYVLEIPPNFTKVAEADNGDGATFRSKEDEAEILVYATPLGDGGFQSELTGRITGEKDDGWNLTYEKVAGSWASYSGTKGTHILYARAIALCDGAAAIFRAQYPQAKRKAFDAKIEEMVKSFTSAEGCAAAGAAPPAAE